MTTRIGIVGSRDWADPQQVIEFLACLDPDEVMIVSGRGGVVDLAAEAAAEGFGFQTHILPAPWDVYGKAAGPMRNTEIARTVDVLIAFWNGHSRGTRDVINKARRYKKALVITGPGDKTLAADFPEMLWNRPGRLVP